MPQSRRRRRTRPAKPAYNSPGDCVGHGIWRKMRGIPYWSRRPDAKRINHERTASSRLSSPTSIVVHPLVSRPRLVGVWGRGRVRRDRPDQRTLLVRLAAGRDRDRLGRSGIGWLGRLVRAHTRGCDHRGRSPRRKRRAQGTVEYGPLHRNGPRSVRASRSTGRRTNQCRSDRQPAHPLRVARVTRLRPGQRGRGRAAHLAHAQLRPARPRKAARRAAGQAKATCSGA